MGTNAGGNKFSHVQPGQKRVMPAAVWNAFLDASDYVRQMQASGGAIAGGSPANYSVKPIRNDSGSTAGWLEVLGIGDPLYGPSDNLDEFRSRPAFKGVTPTISSHTGKFAICLEPIADDGIGMALVSGVVPVKVYVGTGEEWYGFADVKDGYGSYLTLLPCGSAQVLWKESGTGAKWAIVRLGNPQMHVECWCVLDEDLIPTKHATASVYSAPGIDTGNHIEVYDALLRDGTAIPAGALVKATFFLESRTWWVTAARCQ